MFFSAIKPFELYLPNKNIDLSKWSVIACDQFTSEPNYWKKVKRYVGSSKSTLFLIHPEAFLKSLNLKKIKQTMADYIHSGTITKKCNNCFVLVERIVGNRKRIGIIATLDLEKYSFTNDNCRFVKPSEEVVTNRLSARVCIRENSSIEVSHTIMFLNDHCQKLIETIYDNYVDKPPIYDFSLMENGGHIRGWIIDSKKELNMFNMELNKLYIEQNGFLIAVGDGNHSLAAAKLYWEKIKASLSSDEIETNPYRYYMIELVNLFSDGVVLEPINRIVFNCSKQKLINDLRDYLKAKKLNLIDGCNFVISDGIEEDGFSIDCCKKNCELIYIQNFLDEFVKNNEFEIDYIHDKKSLKKLLKKGDSVGIFLNPICKDDFFPFLNDNGVFPKKAFSIGLPNEKKYYLECRVME